MRKGIRKIVALTTALIMVVSLFAISEPTKTVDAAEATLDSSSLVNYSTVLGRAVDFGITASEMQQKGHMETPIAVKLFENHGSNNDVDLAGDDPVHFIIGELKDDSKVILGKAYTDNMIYNVETTSEVKNKVEKHNTCNAVIKYNIQSKTSINKNIDSIIEHIQDESVMLASKTGIDLSTVYNTSNHTLNLTDNKYKDKTVYVNLSADDPYTIDLLKKTRETDQLVIQKYSSTVVVFNMPDSNSFYWDSTLNKEVMGDSLKIDKIQVQVWDGTTLGNKITSGDQGNSGNDTPHNRDIDKEICQKIIWNFPTAKKLEINNTAGTFIVPDQDARVDVNTSAGWVATAGYLENSGEWHYIYHGRSNDVNEGEGIGQMHFAARKAFTDSLTNVKEDTTVTMSADDYNFTLYKTGSDYNTSGATVVGNAANDAQSKIKFPTLSFDTAGTNYYVIKEQDAGTITNGIKKSDGEIDIKLVVAIDAEGTRTFTVSSKQYLSAEDKTNNKIYKSNNDVVMSGVEFSLGAFFNQKVKNTGAIKVTKSVTGAPASANNKEFSYTISNGAGGWVNETGAITTTKTVLKIKNGQTKLFEGLPFGTYTVTEDDTSAQISNCTLKATSVKSGTAVIDVAGETETVALKNDYEQDKGSLKITKTVVNADATTPPADKKYRFAVKNSDGQYVQNISGDLAATKKYLPDAGVSKDGTFTITNLPVGDYTIEEEDATIAEYTLTVTGLGKVTVNKGVSTSVTVNNKYETPKVDSGNLIIKKVMTNDSDTVPAGTTFPISVSFDRAGSYSVNGSIVSFGTNVPKTFNIAAGEQIKITDIIKDTKYTVTEDLTGTEYTGYTNTSIKNTDEDNNDTEKTIVKDKTNTVTVTNKYDKPNVLGSLALVKSIVGELTKDQKEAISFTITGPNSYSKTVNISETDGVDGLTKQSNGTYKYVINNLPVGKYNITETVTDIDGKTIETKYSIGTGSYTNDKVASDVSVKQNATTTVKYVNTYKDKTAPKGGIVIKKIFDPKTGVTLTDAQKKKVTFTITDKNGKSVAVKTVDDAIPTGDITIDGLDVGTYTVTESQYEVTGTKVTTVNQVVVTGKEPVDGTGVSATVSVTAGDNVRVNYTNTYTKDEATTVASSEEVTTQQAASTTEKTTEVTTEATTAQVTTGATTTESVSGTKRKTTTTKKSNSDDDEDEDEDDGDGNLIITIYDEKTGDIVPGAKITVKGPSGKTTKYTTDDNGQVSIKNTAAGTYTVTVTDVPDGYTVTENAEVTIKVENNKTTKAQVKIDKDGDVSVTSKTTKSATKTGDNVPVVPVAAAFIIAVCGLIILMIRRRYEA